MRTDPFTDDDAPIGLVQAGKLPELVIDGRPRLATVLQRWAVRGVRGVKLRSWLIGDKRVTSRAAVREFRAKLDATDPAGPSPPPTPTIKERQRWVRQELARAGI